MEAHARTPRELFEGKVQYEIPPFQRPYVWTETDQWEPLWRDVARVAADIVRDGEASRSETHFLGAVVAASTYTASGDVARHELVDGQQRMTTLQLLLGAVQGVVARHGQAEDAEALQELIRNGSNRFAKSEKRFKLWPSQTDRVAFVRAMEGGAGKHWSEEDPSGDSVKLKPHRLVQAYQWFRAAAERWISGQTDEDDPDAPGDETQRIQALSAVLQDRLTLVAIDLDISDDAQLIFETLNDRGTPLLSADLIKNWLFQQGQRQGVDIDRWARDWAELDAPWWREEVRQGRLNRPRIDGFLQYWLTAQCTEDLRTTEVFRRFVRFARPQITSAEGADRFLHELLDEAAFYRHLDELSPTTPEGRFHQRVLQQFDQATMTPMLLRLAPKRFGVPTEQRRLALESLESWVVRRALLFLETRATNRVVAALLKGLSGVDPVGSASSCGDCCLAPMPGHSPGRMTPGCARTYQIADSTAVSTAIGYGPSSKSSNSGCDSRTIVTTKSSGTMTLRSSTSCRRRGDRTGTPSRLSIWTRQPSATGSSIPLGTSRSSTVISTLRCPTARGRTSKQPG